MLSDNADNAELGISELSLPDRIIAAWKYRDRLWDMNDTAIKSTYDKYNIPSLIILYTEREREYTIEMAEEAIHFYMCLMLSGKYA